MGRRRRSDIDELLESWARWCHSGGVIAGSGSSMLAKMMDNKGLMMFNAGGGKAPMIDCVESTIEGVVMSIANQYPRRADVLRLEYNAGWMSVVKRHQIPRYNPANMGQEEHAAALGISVRTYRRSLAAARDQLERELDLNGSR